MANNYEAVFKRYETLSSDTLLRREAGEGWRDAGINDNLLGAIIAREIIIDELVKQHIHDPDDTSYQEYYQQHAKVQSLKEELGMGDPSPLSLDV